MQARPSAVTLPADPQRPVAIDFDALVAVCLVFTLDYGKSHANRAKGLGRLPEYWRYRFRHPAETKLLLKAY